MQSTVAQTEPPRIITLPLGRVRKPWMPIRRQVVQFRRWLEAAVLEVYGQIDLRYAKLVRTAATTFESAQRIRRTLGYGGEPGTDTGLDHQTWLAYDSALQTREASCDKALAALGLGRDAGRDVWSDILDARHVAQNGVGATQDRQGNTTPSVEPKTQLAASQEGP